MNQKVLWLNFSGSQSNREFYQIEKTPYPLAYNLPPQSWSCETQINVLEQMKDLILAVDLVYVNGIKDSYALCVGLIDASFLNAIESPSVRDVGVCQYYSRWNERSNIISPEFNLKTTDLVEIEITSNNMVNLISNSFDLSRNQIAGFFESFNEVKEGDLVSLGNFSLINLEEINMLNFKISDLDWSFEVIYE